MNEELKIPRVIYFTWISDKPIPEKFNKYIESWKRVMPDWEIKQITLENCNKQSRFVQESIKMKNFALAGHYARVEELYLNGGVYFDIDIEAVKDLEALMHNELVLGIESKWWINNAVIISKALHPFLKDCLVYMDSITDFDSKKIELETGPIMFTNIMKKWGWKPGESMKRYKFYQGPKGEVKTVNDVAILSPEFFYPYHYDQFYTPECITKDTFTVHHWANSWNNKVSIIIPCYNQAQFLTEAIDSALKQTYKDVEIIVINDGSTDNTSHVVNQIKKRKDGKSYKIILIEQENKGLSAARNAGIKKSSGGWILTLDADDKIHPDFLKKTVGVNDIVCSWMQCFGTSKDIWKPPLQNPEYKDFLKRNHLFCCSLFKKDCWTLSGGYDEEQFVKGKQGVNGFEDYLFWLRCTKAGFNISIIPEVLFYYRKRGESMLTESIRNKQKILEYMKKEHPLISKKA